MSDLVLAVAEGEEHNPLLPAFYDILWSLVCFLIILYAFMRFVLPNLRELEAARIQNIEAKLEQAERDRTEAQALLARYREQLAEARSEASRIRTEAQSDRKSIVDEARVEAQEEAARVTERSHAQLRADLGHARTQLSRDVGRIAIDLAEKIVGANLADTDRTRSTVDRFLDELEAATGATPAGVGAGDGGGAGGATAGDRGASRLGRSDPSGPS